MLYKNCIITMCHNKHTTGYIDIMRTHRVIHIALPKLCGSATRALALRRLIIISTISNALI